MAYQSSALNLALSGGLQGNAPSIYTYSPSTDDTSTSPFAVGFFAGAGKGSQGTAGVGMKLGDIVIVSERSSGQNPGRTQVGCVYASTLNVSSTTARAGFSAAYNCTIRGTT